MKVATPLAFVVAGEPVIVAVPAVKERLTDLPETATLFASKSVTVIVDVPVLSAITEVGDAVTLEVLALPTMAVKVTVAV